MSVVAFAIALCLFFYIFIFCACGSILPKFYAFLFIFFCLCFSFETVLCLIINIVSLHSCLFIGFANALLLIKCGFFATVALIIKYFLPPLNGFVFSFANVAWLSQCDMPLFFFFSLFCVCIFVLSMLYDSLNVFFFSFSFLATEA